MFDCHHCLSIIIIFKWSIVKRDGIVFDVGLHLSKIYSMEMYVCVCVEIVPRHTWCAKLLSNRMAFAHSYTYIYTYIDTRVHALLFLMHLHDHWARTTILSFSHSLCILNMLRALCVGVCVCVLW